MSKELAVIVVPIHKTELASDEASSLQQLFSVLGHHHICAITPHSLDISKVSNDFDYVERFPDNCFESINSYNRLMLSLEFYQRFSFSQFILIYQLDAWVFRDELRFWCEKDYDYIGAPWLGHRVASEDRLKRRVKLHYRRSLSKLFGPKHFKDWYPLVYDRRVGNGGFSLRKVKSIQRVIKHNQSKIAPYLRSQNRYYNEDMFFSMVAQRGSYRATAPDWRSAIRFSIESRPDECLAEVGEWPFGCHAWPTWNNRLKAQVLKTAL